MQRHCCTDFIKDVLRQPTCLAGYGSLDRGYFRAADHAWHVQSALRMPALERNIAFQAFIDRAGHHDHPQQPNPLGWLLYADYNGWPIAQARHFDEWERNPDHITGPKLCISDDRTPCNQLRLPIR